jgi:hypothetical protein
MDATLRTRLVNEAKFLRGMLYFDMVRMFGSIPLVLKETEPLIPPIASVDDLYTQIISDLSDAEALPLNYPPEMVVVVQQAELRKPYWQRFTLQEVIIQTVLQNVKK